MTTFKFDNFDDEQFEQFCKDILEYETKTRFSTYRKGRDGGIDIKCIKNDLNWIGQAKHYSYSDYSNLKRILAEEKKKLDILKPSRYSLFISMDLTPLNEEEILNIMNPYLKREDLYTLTVLNDICFKNDFSDIIYNKYPSLIMPPLFFAQKYLIKNQNKMMNVESVNIENHTKLNDFLKNYIAKRILNKNIEMDNYSNIELFIKSVFDWVLCEKRFSVDLITSFILENKTNNKLITKRWEIIECYFEGQFQKGIDEINNLLKDIPKKKKSWQYFDLLIDKRCFENTLNNKEKTHKYNSAQKELSNIDEVYYPLVDRKYKKIYELINNNIIKKERNSNNSFNIIDSTFQQVCETFSDMILDVIYNGSLVHLLLLRKNFANILLLLSKYYDNDGTLNKIYVQNLLVSGHVDDFKKICIRNSVILKNYTSETWNKIQRATLFFEKEEIEIVFSQYLYRYLNKELKNQITKKIIQYYKNNITTGNYYKQEMILNFICDNVEELSIKRFIPLIAKTLSVYKNSTLDRLINNIFKNAKLYEYNNDLNNIFKYILENKLQDVYLFFNLRKIFYQKFNYDKMVLDILEEDLKTIYKDLIDDEVNYFNFLIIALDELEKNNIMENIRIRNLLYGINKIQNQNLKDEIINKFLEVSKIILIKNTVSINTKITILEKILELRIAFNYTDLDYNSVFAYIIDNKDEVMQAEDFFGLEDYNKILELYLLAINNIRIKKFDDVFCIRAINVYNEDKMLKNDVLYLIILLIKLKLKVDLKSFIINIFKDINDSELQDKIIYLYMISYQKYSVLYKELLKNNINITHKTYKLISQNKRNHIWRLLREEK